MTTIERKKLEQVLEALTYCEALNKDVEQQKMQAITAIKEALAQPAPPPPECKTEAEQTAYAFGWWKALESVRTEQPAQEPSQASYPEYDRGFSEGWDRCKAAAQPAQEPVAWRTYAGKGYYIIDPTLEEAEKNWPNKNHHPLYNTPQQRPWVSLTDEERKTIFKLAAANDWHDYQVMDAVESKLKEKNA